MVRRLRAGPRGGGNLSNKKCEGCELKAASFGLPTERKKRWCGDCAPKGARRPRAHAGGKLAA